MQYKQDIYSKSGIMRRSPIEYPQDSVTCAYDAMFYEKSNIVYATISQNTYKYFQVTAHARILVYDDTAFILEADLYYHSNPASEYINPGFISTDHEKELPSNWLEPFKPIGVTNIYNQDRSPEAYILTKRIFHNIFKNLDENLDLPNDIIGIIKDLDLKNSGLEYIQDPGNPEIWPFKVQHINGLTKRPMYRVVAKSHLVEIDNDNEAWVDLPDVINDEAMMMDEAA
jgi:hypothetical protein